MYHSDYSNDSPKGSAPSWSSSDNDSFFDGVNAGKRRNDVKEATREPELGNDNEENWHENDEENHNEWPDEAVTDAAESTHYSFTPWTAAPIPPPKFTSQTQDNAARQLPPPPPPITSAPPPPPPPPTVTSYNASSRDDLFDSIRNGAFQLRKVPESAIKRPKSPKTLAKEKVEQGDGSMEPQPGANPLMDSLRRAMLRGRSGSPPSPISPKQRPNLTHTDSTGSLMRESPPMPSAMPMKPQSMSNSVRSSNDNGDAFTMPAPIRAFPTGSTHSSPAHASTSDDSSSEGLQSPQSALRNSLTDRLLSRHSLTPSTPVSNHANSTTGALPPLPGLSSSSSISSAPSAPPVPESQSSNTPLDYQQLMDKTDRILNLLAHHGIGDQDEKKTTDVGDETDAYSYVHDDSQGIYTKSLEEHTNPYAYVFGSESPAKSATPTTKRNDEPQSLSDAHEKSLEATQKNAPNSAEKRNPPALDEQCSESIISSHHSSPKKRTKRRRNVERSHKLQQRLDSKHRRHRSATRRDHGRDENEHRQSTRSRTAHRRHSPSRTESTYAPSEYDTDTQVSDNQSALTDHEWHCTETASTTSEAYSAADPHRNATPPQRNVSPPHHKNLPTLPQNTPTLSTFNEEELFKRLEKRMEEKFNALLDKKIDDRISSIRQKMNAELKRLENTVLSVEEGTSRELSRMENRLSLTEDLIQHPIDMMESFYGFCGRIQRQEQHFTAVRQQAKHLQHAKGRQHQLHKSYADATNKKLHDFYGGVVLDDSALHNDDSSMLHEYSYVHHSEVPKKIGDIPSDVGAVDGEEDPFAYVHEGVANSENREHRPPTLNLGARVPEQLFHANAAPFVTPSRPPRPTQHVLYFSPPTPSALNTNYFQYSPEVQQLESTLRTFVRPEKRPS